MASTIRGHLVAALETRMILWVGLEFGKGLEFHAEYIIFQHDMKTFSDFPTRVAFREPSKYSLCLQVPSKTSAFLKICNFFSTKSNWIKYWQIGDTAVFVIKVLLTTKKVIVKCTFYGDCNKLEITNYGRPMKPFFIEIPNILGLGWQFRQKIFWVFSADLSAPILMLWVPCPCF